MNTFTPLIALAVLAAPLTAQQVAPALPAVPQADAEHATQLNTVALSWYGLTKQIHAITTSKMPRESKIATLNALKPLASKLGEDVRFFGEYHVIRAASQLMPTEDWKRQSDELVASIGQDAELALAVRSLGELMNGAPAPTAAAPAPAPQPAPTPAPQPAPQPAPNEEQLAQDAAHLLMDVVGILAADKGKEATLRELRALKPRARELGHTFKELAEPHVREAVEALEQGADAAREKGAAAYAATETQVQHATDALRREVSGAREWLHAAKPHLKQAAESLLSEADSGRIPSEEEVAASLINALLAPLTEEEKKAE